MHQDQHGFGVRKAKAKTNAERQRAFVARNPTYYRDRRRKEKARIDAHLLELAAEAQRAALDQQRIKALPAACSEPLVTVQLPLFEQAPEPAPEASKPTPASAVEQRQRAA